MNNAIAMSASFEARKNSRASMITAAFAAGLLLLMFFWTWKIEDLVPKQPEEMFVELNLPDEPLPIPPSQNNGGGGGGNPVQAAGPAGAAAPEPPQPGTKDDAKDIEEDDDKASPPILKPDVAKPTATKINENKSEVKTEPKPDPKPPAPPQPKAVAGRTLSGNGNGGGSAENYDRSGGAGTGYGVGRGSGTGGGSGSGSGGGNGSGTGGGNGPSVKSGDRRIISSYAFQGDLDKATVFAFVKVSPEGNGEFTGIAKGSTATSTAYKNAIIQYLRNMKFNKADHESMVTVQFNFRVN